MNNVKSYIAYFHLYVTDTKLSSDNGVSEKVNKATNAFDGSEDKAFSSSDNEAYNDRVDENDMEKLTLYEQTRQSMDAIRDVVLNDYISSITVLLDKKLKEQNKGSYFEKYRSTRRHSDVPEDLMPIKKRITSLCLDSRFGVHRFRPHIKDIKMKHAHFDEIEEFENHKKAHKKREIEQGMKLQFDDSEKDRKNEASHPHWHEPTVRRFSVGK